MHEKIITRKRVDLGVSFLAMYGLSGFEASSVRRFEMKKSAVIYVALSILIALIVPCCMANPGRGDENGTGVVLSLALP